MRAVVNRSLNPDEVAPPSSDAIEFHRSLRGYAPTPVHDLSDTANMLGLEAVMIKDESNRLGLPAFKILGASWAVKRAVSKSPETETLVAASAGNHGRAVARVAALRGFRCRIYLPARSLPARRLAIESEGAEVVVVDGSYEDAVRAAEMKGSEPRVELIADVGESGPPAWVIDGYQTLFEEASHQAHYDLILVPVGVGSLAAAAARHGAANGVSVVGVEPANAACLSASLQQGAPTSVSTPGTTMAGLDCAEVSAAAWPTLRSGIAGTVAVSDDEAAAAVAELRDSGVEAGASGAAALAGLRALVTDPSCGDLATRLGVGSNTRALVIASEGATDQPPPS